MESDKIIVVPSSFRRGVRRGGRKSLGRGKSRHSFALIDTFMEQFESKRIFPGGGGGVGEGGRRWLEASATGPKTN